MSQFFKLGHFYYLGGMEKQLLFEQLEKYITINDEIRSFLNDDCETIYVNKNNIISRQDQYNRKVFFIEKGLLRSFYYTKGKDITTNFYMEGKLMANIDTLFRNQPTRYNFETIEDSVITVCNFSKLEELCENSIECASLSRYILGNLMTQMATRIASLQYMTAKEKYYQLLEENPNIILRAPLGMIATYLGISQETLSRIRNTAHSKS